MPREEFCARLSRILVERFPDECVKSLAIASDLEHSRSLLRSGASDWAVLAVRHGKAPAPAENRLTFGLLWLERLFAWARGELAARLAGCRPAITSRSSDSFP